MLRTVVIAILALAVTGSAAAITRTPRLALVDREPLAVRGAQFAPRELVRVTVSAQSTQTVRVRATSRGTFVVRFADLPVDRCSGFGIRAVGNRGSMAVLKLPLPACLPARNP